jgi:hypothetical protein
MRLKLFQPHGTLAQFIEYFWVFERHDDAVVTWNTFANVVSGIIFQHHDRRSALGPAPMHRHRGGDGNVPTSFLYGKRTQPSQTFTTGRFSLTVGRIQRDSHA